MNNDETIERNIRGQLESAMDSCGHQFISVLNLSWKRLTPKVDETEHGLKYVDDSVHIYAVIDSLVGIDGGLHIFSDALLYTEDSLLTDTDGGWGLSFNVDYIDLGGVDIDLAGVVPPEIVSVLLETLKNTESDSIAELVSYHDDEDIFLKSIKNPFLRKAITKNWNKHKNEYR